MKNQVKKIKSANPVEWTREERIKKAIEIIESKKPGTLFPKQHQRAIDNLTGAGLL